MSLQILQMLKRSIYFLNHTKQFLDNWVELGQDTCHRTHGYDAEKCHMDCKEREKSDFAKDCKTKGGLFKCCIRLCCYFLTLSKTRCFRRDKEYCHECRYCCTLSVCTIAEGFAKGNFYLNSNKTLEQALHKGLLNGAPLGKP